MTTSTSSHRVVTNLTDLTPAMREWLQRPAEPDLPAEVTNRATFNSLYQRGLVIHTGSNPPTYRLTDAGKRCREAIERETAPVRVVESLGSYGWSMVAENDFSGHAITTWTRDEHVLVLSWTGAYEVSAAIYDGVTLPLEQLVQTVMTETDTSSEHLLDKAARHALKVANPHHAHEIADLLREVSATIAPGGQLPLSVLAKAISLAAAILATPHTR